MDYITGEDPGRRAERLPGVAEIRPRAGGCTFYNNIGVIFIDYHKGEDPGRRAERLPGVAEN